MGTASKAPRYRVAQGTQVHHQGTTYAAGTMLPAGLSDQLIEFWLTAGWIETTT